MKPCWRCGRLIPAPTFQELVNLEIDWRENFPEGEDRVLICIKCDDELAEMA